MYEERSYPYLDNTKSDVRLLGFPNNLYSFTQNTSASRVAMFNHHISQAMILNNPEFNRIFTGHEEKFIDYTFNHSRRKHPCEVLAVIPKYDDLVLNKMSDCPLYYVIVRTLEPKPRLDYFTVERYFMGANGFGFLPQFTDAVGALKPGEILDVDTVLTHSPAVQGNMYCPGTNLKTVYGTFPETIEDAFIISESAAKKLESTQIHQKVIDCRADRRPLNINGTDTIEKFLPDIGSYVREDGVLCAFRPVYWATCLADTDPRSLKEILPLQDDIIYIDPGSKILDISFTVNQQRITESYDQARRYDRNAMKCWEAIYGIYMKYKNDKTLGISEEMSTLVTTALYRMTGAGKRIDGLHNDRLSTRKLKDFELEGANRQAVDFLQAVVTYSSVRKVDKASKLTDFCGAKYLAA